MPNVLNNADWFRTAERQLSGTEVAHLPLKAGVTSVVPGTVAATANGEVLKADKDVDGGAFYGIFLSEVSTDVDELIGGTIPPTVVTGPALMWIHESALDGASTYALGATTGDLVAGDDGVLVPRGANTGPTVALLQEVVSDGIIVHLLAPNAS